MGVSKVVIALIDPDPRNSGAGIEFLRQGGAEVEVGLIYQEAFHDLSSYLKDANKSLQLTAQSAGALRPATELGR